MRHRKKMIRLGRRVGHRDALLDNLATSLFLHERITTTLPRAKVLRSHAERLITKARRDTLHARRLAARAVRDPGVLAKLFAQIGPRFADRPGGYTRIVKLGFRRGDSAELAVIELVSRAAAAEGESDARKGGKRRLVQREAGEAGAKA